MCLAIPGKIIEIDNTNQDLKMASVSFAGVLKNICIEWLPEAKIGDYIMVHVGTALSIVDAKEAEETLNLLRELSKNMEQDNIKD